MCDEYNRNLGDEVERKLRLEEEYKPEMGEASTEEEMSEVKEKLIGLRNAIMKFKTQSEEGFGKMAQRKSNKNVANVTKPIGNEAEEALASIKEMFNVDKRASMEY